MERLSHLPDGEGSLEPKSGLGGSRGAGVKGEYLASSGGGGRNEGLATMTGVWGWDGGEQGGVLSSSLLVDRSLIAGQGGGWVVGLMPEICGGLDINYRVGGRYFSQVSSRSETARSFQGSNHLTGQVPCS